MLFRSSQVQALQHNLPKGFQAQLALMLRMFKTYRIAELTDAMLHARMLSLSNEIVEKSKQHQYETFDFRQALPFNYGYEDFTMSREFFFSSERLLCLKAGYKCYAHHFKDGYIVGTEPRRLKTANPCSSFSALIKQKKINQVFAIIDKDAPL